MKQVEFDIELVKKIQSGEVKGKVHIRDGRIIPNVNNKRRDTDYDGYNDYQRIIIEGE